MFLPLGDSPNPRGVPFVNYALIAINVAVYLLVALPLGSQQPGLEHPLLEGYVEYLIQQHGRGPLLRDLLGSISVYDLFVFEHGFRPVDPSPRDLLTSMFLHGSLAHLAGNMLFLWIYGDNVEFRLGRFGYLLAYLGTGAAATLFHMAFNLDSPVPMVGASGAISGTLGFYFLFFPRNKVRLFVALFPFWVDVILVPARWVLGFYLLIDNLLPFLFQGAASGGVAYGAHIGGFLGGLAVAWVLDRRELRPRRRTSAPRGTPPSITAAWEAGEFSRAADLHLESDGLEEQGLDPELCLGIGNWLAANGSPMEALTVFRRLLRRYPRGTVAARAHLQAGRVQLNLLGRPTAAWQHFLDVLDLEPYGESARIARQGIAAIESAQRSRFGRR